MKDEIRIIATEGTEIAEKEKKLTSKIDKYILAATTMGLRTMGNIENKTLLITN